MHLAISGRGREEHLTTAPPPVTAPERPKWAQKDAIVISWILDNIESELVNQFLDYPTARDLWQGIETLYSSGRDGLQTFDLSVKASMLRQESDPIETFYGKLVTVWKEIDRRSPNPMKHAEDITIYNEIKQRERLYQFLAGVHDSLDKERRDLLLRDPIPTVEEAYSHVRREIIRRGIMKGESSSGYVNPSDSGVGLASKGRPIAPMQSRRPEDRTYLRCSHCGEGRHTKEECFKLHGYPPWWDELKKMRIAERAAERVPRIGRAHYGSTIDNKPETEGQKKREGEDGKGEGMGKREGEGMGKREGENDKEGRKEPRRRNRPEESRRRKRNGPRNGPEESKRRRG